MIPTRCVSASAHVHKPLIHFLGKRIIPKEPHVPGPHPAAPPETRTTFEDFRRKFKAYSAPTPRKGKSEEVAMYNELWEAPRRFWRSRLVLTETEVDAIMSGGAAR